MFQNIFDVNYLPLQPPPTPLLEIIRAIYENLLKYTLFVKSDF